MSKEPPQTISRIVAANAFTLLIILQSVCIADAQKSPQGDPGGVAHSGMAHGEAMIAVRSDVKLSLKGTLGTTSQRINALGEAAGKKMPALRACYAKLVAQQPAIVGRLRILIDLKRGAKHPILKVSERQGTDADLSRCVTKVLSDISLSPKNRPAAAIVTLDFDNTRAQGQALLESRSAENQQVEVEVDAEGRPSTTWKTAAEKVIFTVSADPSTSKDRVAGIMRGFKSQFARFVDCRRRAGSRGDSPAGQTIAHVQVRNKGQVRVKIDSCTVSRKKAQRCLEKAFSRMVFRDVPPLTEAMVTVDFKE